ncbi:MAG: hypothetical protein HFJ97_07655 [Eubacterium sp.]|nr:hypothetical protein [Eubacterium sp.]
MNNSTSNNIDKLINEIEEGRLSGEQQGWLSEQDIKDHFKSKINKATSNLRLDNTKLFVENSR